MPDHDFRTPRLFVDGPLADAASLDANDAQANYLLNVLRLDAGGTVLLFDGRNGEWRARIERSGKKRVRLACEARTRPQPPAPDLLYLFAPLKHARLDYMVQKAVEMGAGVLQPVVTQHTQASRVNVARMRANAIEAAEQCGVLHVPDCCEPQRLSEALARFPDRHRLVFCDERAVMADAADSLASLAGQPLALLVGPEGGFSAGERDMLRALPFVVGLSLGPRILRADTAAVAALAVVQALAGDWRTVPGP